MSKFVRAGLFAAAFASLLSPAVASDRYYRADHVSDASTAYIDDQPLTLALARCYGRYQAIGTPLDWGVEQADYVPADNDARQDAIGAALKDIARKERGESVALSDLVPPRFDEDTGQPRPTGKPVEIYDSYMRGYDDFLRGSGGPSQKSPAERLAFLHQSAASLSASCAGLEKSLTGTNNLGAARDAVYTGSTDPLLEGQPRALVLARCLGRLSSVRAYLDQAAGQGAPAGKDYPPGLGDEWTATAKALQRFAKSDRGESFVISKDVDHPGTLPAAIGEASYAGTQDVGGFDYRPDFWDATPEDDVVVIVLEDAKDGHTACTNALRRLSTD